MNGNGLALCTPRDEANKKTLRRQNPSEGVDFINFRTQKGIGSKLNMADLSPDRVSLLHKGGLTPICAAGADTSSRKTSFVCQTTPHFGSTSREVPTLFATYHIRNNGESKPFFPFPRKFMDNPWFIL